jgi:hypothetical protein
VIRAPRTVAALLTLSLFALAGCGSGDDADRPPSAPPASSAPATSSPSVDSSPSGPDESSGPPQRGSNKLGDLNAGSFTYRGGCGWEVPAGPVELENGKQADDGQEVDGVGSEAELSQQQQVTIDGTQFLLVQLSCTVGEDKLLGAHLIGLVDRKPVDLGIVATGTKLTTSHSGGELRFDTEYRTIDDGEGEATGAASYEIVVVGNTPVRLFDGDSADAIDPVVEQLPAHGYDAGLVGINGYAEDEADSTWTIGLLDEPGRVLVADSLGGGYSGVCWHSTIHTQAGEQLGTTGMAFPGDEMQTGTVVELDSDSEADPGTRGDAALPVEQETDGLLVPANGMVPALATATTETAGNPLADAIVTTQAPADGWLEVWRFGAASGSEYALPFGAFASADGEIAMSGAWFNAPVDPARAGYGMRPIADPDAVGDSKTCS